MFNSTRKVVCSAFAVSSLLLSVSALSSTLFNDGIPSDWECVGNCGTSGANGDVDASPQGGDYAWVSTNGGQSGVGFGGLSGNDGSTLTTSLFSAVAGDSLEFDFNYVTSDGGTYADFAWAALLDESKELVATLFAARTAETGNTVPGFEMPAPEATLTPGTVVTSGAAPIWSVLGEDSGKCYESGCGFTGWIHSSYEIASAGNYHLSFGVANWSDDVFDSGMALDGITLNNTAIEDANDIPEPGTLLLVSSVLFAFRRFTKK